jgi:hypothetical protein
MPMGICEHVRGQPSRKAFLRAMMKLSLSSGATLGPSSASSVEWETSDIGPTRRKAGAATPIWTAESCKVLLMLAKRLAMTFRWK